MKIDSVGGSYLDDKPDLSDWLYCKMLPSSVEQFIIELVAWAGSRYDFFHLDGTHPVKVEPLLKSKVWIIIFLFDYWFKDLEFRMRNILKQKIW
ncbi:hypothetical protein Peur_024631 [Populus x canadensis]